MNLSLFTKSHSLNCLQAVKRGGGKIHQQQCRSVVLCFWFALEKWDFNSIPLSRRDQNTDQQQHPAQQCYSDSKWIFNPQISISVLLFDSRRRSVVKIYSNDAAIQRVKLLWNRSRLSFWILKYESQVWWLELWLLFKLMQSKSWKLTKFIPSRSQYFIDGALVLAIRKQQTSSEWSTTGKLTINHSLRLRNFLWSFPRELFRATLKNRSQNNYFRSSQRDKTLEGQEQLVKKIKSVSKRYIKH